MPPLSTLPGSEPVQQTLWDIVSQGLSLAVAFATLGTLCYPLARWLWKRYKAKRDRERRAHEKARRAQIHEEVESVIGPLREQVDAIHHTTHTNGGKNSPPTLRDDLCQLRKQQDTLRDQQNTALQALGGVAVQQARLASRFDQHLAEDHGKQLEP
jgi:hypothetical protein